MKLETRAKKLRATIPTQGSKLYSILYHLHYFDKLTVVMALSLHHTTELRKHVSRLKDYGWPIKSKRVNTSTGWYNEYYL